MIKMSFFQSTTKPGLVVLDKYYHVSNYDTTLENLIANIQGGTWEMQIDHARANNYAESKKQLPCFTPSGIFPKRRDDHCQLYSQVICLDYDKVAHVFRLKNRVAESPYTLAAFYSPSMSGLKVLVKITSGQHQHLQAFNMVKNHFDEFTGLISDPRVKNLSRLCFVSHDKDPVYRPDAKPFEVMRYPVSTGTSKDDFIKRLEKNGFINVQNWLFEFTRKGGKYQGELVAYEPSQRNNFLYVYACNANRYGIDQADATDYALETARIHGMDKMTESEVRRTVNSAYRHTHEHGKYKLPDL